MEFLSVCHCQFIDVANLSYRRMLREMGRCNRLIIWGLLQIRKNMRSGVRPRTYDDLDCYVLPSGR